MKKHSTNLILPWLLILIITQSCKKDWLDAKPVKSLAIPHTLRDYKSLLSSTIATGAAFNDNYATITEYGAGDFSVSNTTFTNAGNSNDRNFYSWKADLWGDNSNYGPWNTPYYNILYTNVVLDGIDAIIPANNAEQLDWNQTKGSAYFLRAVQHYEIAKQFCKAYNKSTASSDLGIPLRLSSDFNEVSVRSSLEQSYNQIIGDLKNSAALLPIATPINDMYKCTPTTTAAYAMLARVYLAMSNYDSAMVYSDKTLQLYNKLLDYNNITTGAATASTVAIANNFTPFARFNDEVIFQMKGSVYQYFYFTNLIVDSNLMKSYNINDRRAAAFFRSTTNGYVYKGSYEPATLANLWTGLATDEIYLTRAECRARQGNLGGALADLNTLMIRRWRNDNGSWSPIGATDINDALKKILAERRKELCFRGIRWVDLKRLNLDPQFAVTLTKTINGQTYTLPPNSPLYVFSIPPPVIQLSGMPQNPR